MYRLSLIKLLSKSSLCFSNFYSTAVFALPKYNITYLNKISQYVALKNFNTLVRKIHTQSINITEFEEKISTLTKAFEQQGRVYAHYISNIIEQHSIECLGSQQGLLLLQCCGQTIVDKPPSVRATLCDQVWAKLEELNVNLGIQHYNKYLQICIENKVKLNYLNFLQKIRTCEPNEETYSLLLLSACQLGDVSQAIQIMSEMKTKNYPADEKVFNALVLGNAINGGLKDAKTVLNAMQITRVTPSPITYTYLLCGIAERQNYNEFMEALQMCPGEILEDEFLNLLQILGLHGNHAWIDQVINKTKFSAPTLEGLWQINLLCIHLIHMGQSEAAVYYVKRFILPRVGQEEISHPVFIFVEMLLSGMPVKKVIEMVKDLSDAEYIYTIQKLTEIVLRKGLIDCVWDLFVEMPNLRPHYFWPVFIKAASTQRENGIFNVLTRMLEFGIKPDMDTLELYVIPHCDTNDPRSLLIRLKHMGFSYKELLTPLLCFLLKENRTTAAQKLCSINENMVADFERITYPLARAWLNTKDSQNVIMLLKQLSDPKESVDNIGNFLLRLFKACKTAADKNNFTELIKLMKDQNLKISSASADFLLQKIKQSNYKGIIPLQRAVERLIDNSLNHIHSSIPHPRNMSVNQLENHLIELQNKNMETRGVLRKLIQYHCRLGNETRVEELRQLFFDAGYNETAGMKAALFHAYVSKGNDVNALNMYKEIKVQHPKFLLDDFKIMDFATLLVQNNKYDTALKMLSENRAVQGGPNIIRNCWLLISAAKEESQVQQLYQLLINKGYCIPCNIILGPLVKIHMEKGNLEKAVEVYAECAEKYKFTPLQVELLCTLMETEDEKLLQKALNITSKVHGPDATSISLISALSQAGLHKSLRKFLLEMSNIHEDEIIKLCDRFFQCNDVSALETLAQAVFNISKEKFDESCVYNYVMQAYGVKNDCESAVKFYRKLLDLKVKVPATLTQELLRMVHRCNYTVTEDLLQEQVRS